MLRVMTIGLLAAGCITGPRAMDTRLAEVDCRQRKAEQAQWAFQLADDASRTRETEERCWLLYRMELAMNKPEAATTGSQCAALRERARLIDQQRAQLDVEYAHTGATCEVLHVQADDQRRRQAVFEAVGDGLQGIGNGLSAAGRVQSGARTTHCTSRVSGQAVVTDCD